MQFSYLFRADRVLGRALEKGGASGTLGAAMPGRLSLAVRDCLAMLEKHHKTVEIRRGGGKREAMPDTWTRRTGNLARSFRIFWKPGDLQGAYGSASKYAKVVEAGSQKALGGPIRPREKKFLAIPIGSAKYGVGGGIWPRDRHDLFMIRSRKGNLLLVRRKGGGVEPMFLLRRKVTIPPRPALDRTLESKNDEITQKIADAAMEVL